MRTRSSVAPGILGLLLVAGICYAVGLGFVYTALQIGKVSIVAPIIATEGAVAAVIAVVFGDPIGLTAGAILAMIAIGVVMSSIDRAGTDVPAGDIDLVADALDGPPPSGPLPSALSHTPPIAPGDTRRSALLAVSAALIFGVGLFASGTAASFVPVAWVALSARVVGLAVITLPVLMSGRLRLTRAVLPLLVIAGVGEMLGSMASAWGARESIAIVAVLGSQFAAITAVIAFLLFGERLEPRPGRRGRARRPRSDGARPWSAELTPGGPARPASATLRPRDHPPGPPAQLFDHRAHRPRQVDAR